MPWIIPTRWAFFTATQAKQHIARENNAVKVSISAPLFV